MYLILLAFFTLAASTAIPRKWGHPRYESVAYWGQTPTERSLADYCAHDEGFDILIIAFLSSFGNGIYPHGWMGKCQVRAHGRFFDCATLATDIEICKALGKKVFISVGGGGAIWNLTSTADAQGVAYSLWNSYANPAVTSSSPRPFGTSFVDGWDFDIESNPRGESHKYLGDLVNALRGYFSSDPWNDYYISGAPQCEVPAPDNSNAIKTSQFDYLWIQFYNNDCGAAELTKPLKKNPDGQGNYDFARWPKYLAGTPSANAKLYVGLPASKRGAGPYFWVAPRSLPEVIGNSTGVPGFNGVMLWDAGLSDFPEHDGCNYAQQVRHVLDTGEPC